MESISKNVRVRIAPSPTGIPHIGNTRTALFNYLFAKKYNGAFLLRIEDTDQKRLVPGSKEAIFEILDWLGIKVDDTPYIQSEHMDVYNAHIEILLSKKIAYKKEGAIWIAMPQEREYQWKDGVGNKIISFPGSDQKDFVAIKSDGYPTYHFASVVDDHLMAITHVFRGDEWISSTPKHLYLYEAFEWKNPMFVHLPNIVGPDKQKLSKRHGAKSALDYRDEGYIKEALINFMAFLGWNPGGDKEILSLDEMIQLFDLKDVNTASPIFDVKKLEWMNGVYIRNLSANEFKSRLFAFDKTLESDLNTLAPSDKQDFLVAVAKTSLKTLADFRRLVFWEEKKQFTQEEKAISQKLVVVLDQISDEDFSKKFLDSLKEFKEKEQVSMKKLYYLLMRKEQGLPLVESAEIFGKQWFLDNLTK